MRRTQSKLSLCLGLFLFSFYVPNASAYGVDPEDMQLIQNASCSELIREYRNYSAGERQLAQEIRETDAGTAAGNALGVATMATLGVGFFSWDNSSGAEENLAELRAYRIAIGDAAKRKGCGI